MTAGADVGIFSPELQAALHGDMVPKFLATQDAAGAPNVVPIISLDAADDRTLIFAELFIWKTRANLATDTRVGVAVVTGDLHVWTLRGTFRGFVEDGPYVERMNQKDMFRYNAYVGVRRVGVIDVERIESDFSMSKPGLAVRFLLTKLVSRWMFRRGTKTLPPRVAEKFARSAAVKVIACRGSDGYPHVFPAFSLLPTQSEVLVFGMENPLSSDRHLTEDARLAAAVITMDPVAYQLKGVCLGRRFTPVGHVGCVRCDEVYSASPPLPGERIELHDAGLRRRGR